MHKYMICCMNDILEQGKPGSPLLQAHVVHMGVGLIHNLLLQQLLNDVLNGDDAHRGRGVVLAKPCQARLAALRGLRKDRYVFRAGL